MIDIHRLPVSMPDLYETHSRLAEARIPPPATLCHIYRAKRWRRIDEQRGNANYSRHQRIRLRKRHREPITFDHMLRVDDVRRTHTVPSSHKGRAA